MRFSSRSCRTPLSRRRALSREQREGGEPAQRVGEPVGQAGEIIEGEQVAVVGGDHHRIEQHDLVEARFRTAVAAGVRLRKRQRKSPNRAANLTGRRST